MKPKANQAASITQAAALYLILGAAGLSMAVAPGYASPVFPAAGLAVAAMLWSRGTAWPGILLGSFCLNLGLAWVNANLNMASALVALGISIGSTAQAAFAWWLVRRFLADAWQTCESELHVFKMLAIAGPLACVVSATVGVSVLVMGSVIPASASLDAWWSWWSGDTLGVLVMLPLGLALFLAKDPAWRTRRLKVALPMVMALALVAASYLAVSRWEQQRIQDAVRDIGQNFSQTLQARFTAHQESLSALRRLITVTPRLSYDDFAYFTDITLRDNPDIFALSVNPYVLGPQRAAFEADFAKRLGEPGFMIRERIEGKLVRAGDHPVFVPVGFIAPLKGNRPALGFDIFSESRRRDAIERAIAQGAPAVTPPIQLVQEQRKRVGVLVMHPVFQGALNAQNNSPVTALAVGVIKADEMIEIVAKQLQQRQVEVRVYDRDAPKDTPELFSSVRQSDAARSGIQFRSEIAIADRFWALEVVPTPDFLSQQTRWVGYAVGVAGLTLATLMQILLLGITGRTAAVERQVREQTAELNAAGKVLGERNAQLDTIFTLSPDGLVTFDEQDRVEFANPAALKILGWTLDEIQKMDRDAFEAQLREQCLDSAAWVGLDAPQVRQNEPDQAQEFKQRIRLKGGDRRVIELKVRAAEGASLSRILYLRDVTYEAEVDRLKSEFLAHAAHELRTPLTSIHGFGELLLHTELDAQTQRELLETIYRHSSNLIKIINELLDLARIEEGSAQKMHLEPQDLVALTRQACSDIKWDSQRWPVQLGNQFESLAIHADPGRIRQALLNILGNAQKYSPQGGAIEVDFVVKETHCGVQIRDHGLGLTPGQLERIGQRFWRADTSGNIPGTGLGVGIVKEILTLHGGRLQIDSEHGQGSVFTLWLPRLATAASIASKT